MNKEELLDEIDYLINDEIDIKNLQSDDFTPDRLETLWEVRKLIEQLE